MIFVGILILTSNRVGTFDETFEFRIQLTLHYETLQEWQRKPIWETFIKRLEDFSNEGRTPNIESEEFVDIINLRSHLDDLAKLEMNGRQIRNAITTARQLALYKKAKMNYKHLQHFTQVASKFDQYLYELYERVDDNTLAYEDGVR